MIETPLKWKNFLKFINLSNSLLLSKEWLGEHLTTQAVNILPVCDWSCLLKLNSARTAHPLFHDMFSRKY